MSDFIKFIQGLAEHGETALLVKQQPIIRGGVHLSHGDGSLKYSWPAFMPTHTPRDGEAWYLNTGSFILDRFTDGRPSASAAHCEYVLCMMLDDIGTKSKEPPLQPTWIIETSPGSFQWGYAFSDQPTKAEFTAAIKAIAAAGYTDPGATNAVRNFRIPGSTNLKPGRDGFKARRVSFNPEREFTLPGICAALGVTPDEADTARAISFRLRDTGKDSVLEWLNDKGLVLSHVNAEGWMGVVCPNHAQHTDGQIEARYNPTTRAFCCFHGHCEDLDSQTFLNWVAGQGGPKAQYGMRQDLISDQMVAAMRKMVRPEGFLDPQQSDAEIRKLIFGDATRDIAYGQFFARVWRDGLLHIAETQDLLHFDASIGWQKIDTEKTSLVAAQEATRQMGSIANKVNDADLRGAILKHAGQAHDLRRLHAMAKLGFAQPGMWASFSDFDTDPAMVGVRNGILDLKAVELRPPAPSLLVSKRMRVTYDPSATCPLFERFLNEIQPEPDVRRLLRQLSGIWLWGEPLIQKIVFMYGLGANGKSTFMEIMAWVLGDYAVRIQTETLMSNQRSAQSASPDLMALKGARLAFCNETGEDRKLDAALVKDLTGGDTIAARPLYGKLISFRPSHSLVMVGNHKPVIRETSDGMWRRIMLIGFWHKIPEGQRDARLPEKLKAEGAGILNWALAGLADYQTNGLNIPASVCKATLEYQAEQDVLGEWLGEHLEWTPEDRVLRKDAYRAYRFWARENGHGEMSQKKLTCRLKERGVESDARYYLGWRLNASGQTASIN